MKTLRQIRPINLLRFDYDGNISKKYGGQVRQLSFLEDISPPTLIDSHSLTYAPSDLMTENDIPYLEVETLLEAHLRNELSVFEMPDIKAIAENDISAKYRFSSALQKSVRRGYTVDAIRYGLSYLQLDASSFWTRLPVIALEDVGLANPLGVALTLAAARSKVFRQKIGGDERVAGYVIKILTEGIKDRSVCDMMQIHWHRSLKHKELTTLKKASLSELAEISLSENLPSSYRTSAGWLMWGTNRHENKNLPLRAGSKEMFWSMIERLHIPALIKYICLRGMTGCRFPMPIVYPFMWQRMQKSMYFKIKCTCFPTERFYIGDVPEEAFCQYTRQGKTAFAHFCKSCSPVDDWLTSKGIISRDARMAAIGAAVFICESALLDRRLDFEGTSEIYDLEEKYDYENVGLGLDDGRTLARMILDNHEILRRSRQLVVAGQKN